MGKNISNLHKSVKEDEVLIQDFKQKNIKSFDKLVLKYQDMIFNLCFRMMGDYDMANDCAQETFIRIYNNIDKFKFKSSFSTWIYRIAVNICKNHLSSKSYRQGKKMLSINGLEKSGDDNECINPGDEIHNPSEIFEKNEQARLIQEAIDTLPKAQKTLVVLRDIEGKSYEEIVSITGINPGTVKSKLSRARNHLRQKLRGVIYNEVQ